MATRQEQKDETRRRLLADGARIVAQKGFAQTRTADVALEAGLSHGTLFLHFPSRDDLILEVARELGRGITDRLNELAARGSRLREVLTAHLTCIAEREVLYRHLLVEGPLLPDGFRTTWTGIQSAISHHVARVAEPAMEAGTIRRMPQHLLFNTWIGLVHHYLINRDLFVPFGSVLARHGKALRTHFLALLAP